MREILLRVPDGGSGRIPDSRIHNLRSVSSRLPAWLIEAGNVVMAIEHGTTIDLHDLTRPQLLEGRSVI